MKLPQKLLDPLKVLACALAAGLLYLVNPLSGINYMMQDMLGQRPSKPQGNIFVIGIDDESLDAIGPWHTWSREHMADIIRLLCADETTKPAVIGVDIMYFGYTTPAADGALAKAAADAGNVILASQLNYTEKIVTADGTLQKDKLHIEGVSLPYAELDAAAESGFTNIFLDSDGACRHNLYKAQFEGKEYYNFAYMIYQKYAQSIGMPPVEPPADSIHMWYVPYSAKPGAYGKGLSFIDVMNGEVPLEIFKDAIVIIGPYASGMLDAYYTPVDKSTPMYGSEINANIVQALCEENFKRQAPAAVQTVVVALAAALCLILLRRLPVGMSVVFLILITFGWASIVLIAGRLGWILDALYIPLCGCVIYAYTLVRNYLTERHQRQVTMNTFKRYVSPQIVEDIFKSKEVSLSLGGTKREIAVMFIDIRGFTPLSESMSPENVVSILNEYLTLVTTMIFRHGGTLDKFIGDAAMALYNAPFDQEDYVFEAVATAYDIAQNAETLEKRLFEQFGKSVRFGMGVNCGEAVIGNIGAEFRMDYTAIGDTVNTAARLESNAKAGQILISDHVYQVLKGRITVAEVGTIPLKGKSERLNVYRVLSLTPPPPGSEPIKDEPRAAAPAGGAPQTAAAPAPVPPAVPAG